ncbi:hypothetical protein AK812_SmicGene15511 [Symbiodinium microadriaticum]|uniref:Uncharacterized protein n=1 Tax=Symbiodinium microadriaticum TaxID=2951 RepID=A0A1Q9E2Q7_SYMMI|nr:hypothetical protein AK812_SmicGene15511 [Symbiodinium microadriaticum]
MRPRAADMRPRHRRPAPPPDEFCPEVPLMWKRQLRKAPRLPRLDKMRLTTASERLLQRKRLPKGQWWDSIVALVPSEAVGASTPTQMQISSKASSVGDDSCRSDVQAAVARSLLADIMVAQAESEGNDAATWTDVDLDLNFADLRSADVSNVVAQVFVTQLTTPSPDSGKHSGSARELARSPEDGLHSEIAQELAYQIVARPPSRRSETVEASLQASAVSPALALVSTARSLDRACSAVSQITRGEYEHEASEDEGSVARIARDVVSIAGKPHERPPRLSAASQHELSDANTESIAARSVARQAIAPLMHELRCGGYREEPHSADSSPGDLEMAALIQNAIASTMARGFTLTPEPVSLHGGDESHHDSNLNTDSMVANSIVRQAVLPHLADSAAGDPARSSRTAGIEENIRVAPSDVGSAHAVARDLVTSASRQQAEESRSATPHSHAVISDNTESLVANSIARQALLPHLADSDTGTPAQTAGVEEVIGAAPSDVGSAHAVARDLVTSASRQQADESRSATPHSHAVISDNTESLVANSIARQALLPHLADSDSGTPAQTAGVEEVIGAAPSDVGDSAHAVARDLVTSASRQQADESRSATPHSHAVISDNTESLVANSIARQALLPHLADSDSGTPAQTAGVEEVIGAAPSDVGDSAHAVARDLVTSASRQQADESRSATPHSHAVISDNTESLVANSIARQALLPHLADSDSGTPAQTAGVEEVIGAAPSDVGDSAHAVARDLVTSASRQQADESRSATPHSHAVISDNTESLVANSIARQALLPHLADSDSGTPAQTAGVEEVIGAAPSDVGDSAHAVARDLVTSASRQQADDSEVYPPSAPSVHDCERPEGAARSVAREAADQLGRKVGQWQRSPKNGFEPMRENVQGPAPLDLIPPVSPGSPAPAEERIVCHEVLRAHNESGRSLAAEAIASQEGACDASPASAAVLSEGSVDARYLARDAVHPFML